MSQPGDSVASSTELKVRLVKLFDYFYILISDTKDTDKLHIAEGGTWFPFRLVKRETLNGPRQL